MSKHYRPEHEPRNARRKPAAARTTERTARDAGRKLLLFALAAIVIVLAGAYWLSRS